jgi:hypothetical protein
MVGVGVGRGYRLMDGLGNIENKTSMENLGHREIN